ncbi:MAG: argininosuccinate lyase [Methylacidiphilales bacterium]|nr:argininosuccinate lyase [Candidatus Methylacidiphilales bacterium]MDW8349675.1 argininosuccinate lyase [Verrucomicrobiae bacterium]
MTHQQRGGRFHEPVADAMRRFSQSVSFDWRLYREDIEGSIAHARMLRKIGILKPEELSAIEKGLRQIEKEIEQGEFHWREDLEDVHMNIEAALTAIVPVGAKLHTGRSRNDQVATDVRLWLKKVVLRQQSTLQEWQRVLLNRAERDIDVLLPGYTHLQRAQPVRLAHHWLAYVEMAARDHDRLQDALKRIDVLPLGSGALAGSMLPLDREFVRRELGFAALSRNSMDAVSDRDFIVEYVAAATLIAVHLSRLAEDLILWSSAEFDFVRVPDAFATGSSLMPQKRNPDAAELARGKVGRVLGNLVSLVTMLKGLPMTYNRDLQEDKERLFDTVDTIDGIFSVMIPMVRDLVIREEACLKAVEDAQLLATDVADWLVTHGVAFRDAHHIVGRLVKVSEEHGCSLRELPLVEWRKVSPIFDERVLEVFKLPDALEKRVMVGAPSRRNVVAAIEEWKGKLSC